MDCQTIEQSLWEAVNQLPLIITIYDESFRLEYANPKALQDWGCQLEEIVGLSDIEIMQRFCCGKEIRPLRDIIKKEKLCKNVLRCFRTEYGEKVTSMDVYRLPKGRIICLCHDVDKLQAFKNLKMQTQTILNAIANYVVMIDVSGRIIVCNKSFELAVEMNKDEILGRDIFEFAEEIKFNKREYIRQVLDELAQGKSESLERMSKELTIEAEFIAPFGKRMDILLHPAIVYDMEGEVVGVIGIASDITQYNKEKERLRQQEKDALIGQMATGMVHEIRNPLTTIKGFAELIFLNSDQHNVRQYARFIDMEVDRINQVATNFLQFARPRGVVLKETTLNETVDSLRIYIDTNAFMRRISVSYVLSPNNMLIMADADQIRHVILNIVKNAMEILIDVKKPLLEIKTFYNHENDEMGISICNNGRTMTEEEKAKAILPFYTTKTEGTGLGLSICSQIINEHHGRIEIQSEIETGTSFIVYFPCKRESPVEQVSETA